MAHILVREIPQYILANDEIGIRQVADSAHRCKRNVVSGAILVIIDYGVNEIEPLIGIPLQSITLENCQSPQPTSTTEVTALLCMRSASIRM